MSIFSFASGLQHIHQRDLFKGFIAGNVLPGMSEKDKGDIDKIKGAITL